MFTLSLVQSQGRGGKIQVNKKNTQTKSTTTPSRTTKTTIPTTNNTNRSYNNRVRHDNNLRLEHLEAGYTVEKLGQNSKHNFYRITGHIYSNLNEAIFCHNRRIIMFQIDNWDSGILNDNLQSIDGYQTKHVLNNQAPLYQFGNSTVRDFAFDFKVKLGRQPTVRAELIKDWAPLSEYEEFLMIDFASLSGTYEIPNNKEVAFNMQFSPQGDQIIMEDLYKQQISWVRVEDKTYVRQLGTPPSNNGQNQNGQTGSPNGGYLGNGNNNRNNNTNNNNSSNYPQGGYLGNGNNKSDSNSTNNSRPSNYPSGGYLGNGNSNNSNQGQGNSNNSNQGQGNAGNIETAYSSAIQIVDRSTLKYFNSEGIAIELKRKLN